MIANFWLSNIYANTKTWICLFTVSFWWWSSSLIWSMSSKHAFVCFVCQNCAAHMAVLVLVSLIVIGTDDIDCTSHPAYYETQMRSCVSAVSVCWRVAFHQSDYDGVAQYCHHHRADTPEMRNPHWSKRRRLQIESTHAGCSPSALGGVRKQMQTQRRLT